MLKEVGLRKSFEIFERKISSEKVFFSLLSYCSFLNYGEKKVN